MTSRRIGTAVAAILLPLVLAGCGNGDVDEMQLADLSGGAAIVWCSWAFECCTEEELQDFSFDTETECRTIMTAGMAQILVEPLQDAVSAGRGEYDAEKALKCLEAAQDMGCTGTNNPEDFFKNCSSPWTPKQTAGQDCATLYECVPETYCNTDTNLCVTPAAETEACTPDQHPHCSAGLYCDFTSCQKRKAADADCLSDGECELGLECTQGKCTPPEPKCTGRT